MKSDVLSKEETAQMDEMRKADAVPMVEKPEESPAEVAVEKPVEKPIETKTEEESDQPDNRRRVPVSELIEERKARQAAEKSAQQHAIEMAKAEERMKLINEAISARQPNKTEIPDPEKNALEALKYNSEKIKQFESWQKQESEKQQVAQQISTVWNKAAADEIEFTKANPDYNDAGAYLRNLRANQLAAMGKNQQEIILDMQQNMLGLAYQAQQSGKNVGEFIYTLAKASGYAKKDIPANGQAAQVNPTSDAEKIARIAEGQRANASLSDVSGKGPNTNPLTAQSLAKMDEKEFGELLKKMSKKEQQAYFGN